MDRGCGVDKPGPIFFIGDRIRRGIPQGQGRLAKDGDNFVGRKRGVNRKNKRGGTGHMGAGHRRTAHSGVAIIPDGRQDIDARGHDTDVRPEVRERGSFSGGSGGANGEDAGIGGRVGGITGVVVAHSRDDNHAAGDGVGNGFSLDGGIAIAAKTHVDNSRTMVNGPTNSNGNIGGAARAGDAMRRIVSDDARKHLHRQDGTSPGNSGDTDRVIGTARDDSGDMGAVAHFVLGLIVADHPISLEMRPGRRFGTCEVHHVLAWQ